MSLGNGKGPQSEKRVTELILTGRLRVILFGRYETVSFGAHEAIEKQKERRTKRSEQGIRPE